ncbi:MAG TPA: hypothetical protein PLP61_03395 [Nocardioides sp.]|uniref:hypothetical protein n=1 Tax=Nocardioides sp. TaxID=35761 RepID=UPI002CF450E1|nr:hypothetical protein [Nocardioides sp.]HQR26064.1 hypothetical protein [Nocardioides sp.]
MTDWNAVLEAHVRFELTRWSAASLQDTVREEAEALLGWLGTVRLAELVPPEEATRAAAALAEDLALTDELLEVAAVAVAAAHARLRHEGLTVAALVTKEDYDAMVDVVVRMDAVRRGAIDAVTESEAYSGLVARVLYHGVKAFVLTENVVARKIPGASSLVRLGQRGLSSAAPGLEANLDRQLTAFVRANIADTLRDGRRYLEESLDETMLRAMADEVWQEWSRGTVASLAEPLEATDLADLVRASSPVLRRLRDAGLLGELAARAVDEVWELHGDRPVAELLQELGLDARHLADTALLLLPPLAEHALARGFLEARIRARLEPFYAAQARTPAGRRPRRS